MRTGKRNHGNAVPTAAEPGLSPLLWVWRGESLCLGSNSSSLSCKCNEWGLSDGEDGGPCKKFRSIECLKEADGGFEQLPTVTCRGAASPVLGSTDLGLQ